MALNLTVWMRALFRLPGPAKIEVRVIDDRGQAILPTITAEVLSPPEIKDEVSRSSWARRPFSYMVPHESHISGAHLTAKEWERNCRGLEVEQGGPEKIGKRN